jgi:hypothetical protein
LPCAEGVVIFEVEASMTNQVKSVAKLISTILANTAVVGFALAIYDNKLEALTAGMLATALAIYITWRTER